MTLDRVIDYLKAYPRHVKIMEVCGTHTSVIVKNGIRGLISPKIRLVSGPGCPVCVTPAGYIDTLAERALGGGCVLSFGDLFRVPGVKTTFAEAKAGGGDFRVIYSPFDALMAAAENPDTEFTVAAVGFETTAPVYAALLEELIRRGIKNVRLSTALKTMPRALEFLSESEEIDGFLCPGHVASVIGCGAFQTLSDRFKKPFVISGFTPEHILIALYHILRQLDTGTHSAENLYQSAVTPGGNAKAQAMLDKYFTAAAGHWRGIGFILRSALEVRPEYSDHSICGAEREADGLPAGCRCGDVMLGRINPDECALYGTACRPESPVGACMVSGEGSCGIWYGAGGYA